MASFNRVILIGNLTDNITLRYLQSGTAVTDVTLAVNDRRKSQAGEWIQETAFVEVTIWGRTAEVASEYLGKGSPMLVEGRLKQDNWETQDGQKRSKLRVVCEKMQMLGGAKPREGGPPTSSSSTSSPPAAAPPSRPQPAEFGQPASSPPPANPDEQSPPEDDIPF